MPRVALFGPDSSQIAAAAWTAITSNRALNLALAGASPGTRQLAYNLIQAELIAVAVLDPAEPLIAGWRLHHRLTTAARASLQPPYSAENVDLYAYHVKSRQPHEIDVIVNGKVRGTIQTSLDIDITVAEFTAVIRAGRLVSVRAGKSKVSGALTMDGMSVLRGELNFDLAATVPLGGGVPLT